MLAQGRLRSGERRKTIRNVKLGCFEVLFSLSLSLSLVSIRLMLIKVLERAGVVRAGGTQLRSSRQVPHKYSRGSAVSATAITGGTRH